MFSLLSGFPLTSLGVYVYFIGVSIVNCDINWLLIFVVLVNNSLELFYAAIISSLIFSLSTTLISILSVIGGGLISGTSSYFLRNFDLRSFCPIIDELIISGVSFWLLYDTRVLVEFFSGKGVGMFVYNFNIEVEVFFESPSLTAVCLLEGLFEVCFSES